MSGLLFVFFYVFGICLKRLAIEANIGLNIADLFDEHKF